MNLRVKLQKNMKNDKPIIHLYIQGACGNQFFQYSFARAIQEYIDAELIINYYFIKKHQRDLWAGSDNLLKDFNVVPYKYESRIGVGGIVFQAIRLLRDILRLKDFSPRTYKAMVRWADFFAKHGIYYFDASYYPFHIVKKKNIYIYGYFESSKYFEKIDKKIIHELVPKNMLLESNKELFERITNFESVCVTIKRQDIQNSKTADIYDYSMDYFYSGIKYIKSIVKDPIFVIFSDDIDWCKKNVVIDGNIVFETEGNPIWEKIRLMSACKHFIIHNSTFSWWAQHLSNNPGKIVVAPSLWMIRNDQPIDIYEQNWTLMNARGEIVETYESLYHK